MSEDVTKCGGCGSPLVDGGVDWFCPNKDCSYEWDMARARAAEFFEQRERDEYERLKAKFANPPAA